MPAHASAPGGDVSREPDLWFVTVTVGGAPTDPVLVRHALERLASERPFLVSAHYDADRADVRYWDECHDVEVAVAQALRLWRDHMESSALPDWTVLGVEVLERETARRRWDNPPPTPRVHALGEILPMEP